jgi:hypothetical protein
MKTKLTQFIPVIIALLIIGFRYFSQWCIITSSSCYGTWIHQIYLTVTNPLFYFSVPLLLAAVILIFVPRSVFNSWLKFAAWAIPLSFILTALTPDSNPGAYMVFYPFYRDDAARLAGELFAGFSFLIIIYKSFVLYRIRRVLG